MIFLLIIFIFFASGFAIYWSAKRQLYALQALITVVLLVACSYMSARLGMSIERAISANDSRVAQNHLQFGFDALAKDAIAGRFSLLANKVIYLNEKWGSTDLLLDDGSVYDLRESLESTVFMPSDRNILPADEEPP